MNMKTIIYQDRLRTNRKENSLKKREAISAGGTVARVFDPKTATGNWNGEKKTPPFLTAISCSENDRLPRQARDKRNKMLRPWRVHVGRAFANGENVHGRIYTEVCVFSSLWKHLRQPFFLLLLLLLPLSH